MKDTLENNLITLFIVLDNKNKRRDVFLFLHNLGYSVYDLNMKKVVLDKITSVGEIIGKIAVIVHNIIMNISKEYVELKDLE